jgi:hypothetical protein
LQLGTRGSIGPPSSYLSEIRQQIKLWAELEGKLATQATVNLQQINIYESPEWSAVGDLLLHVLAKEPALKAQIAAGLLALAREKEMVKL